MNFIIFVPMVLSKIKSWFFLIFSKWKAKQLLLENIQGDSIQKHLLPKLIKQAENTIFGQKYKFQQITDYPSFKNTIPLSVYEDILPYIQAIQGGKSDVLWPGRPIYLAKTSGTTASAKYIPISKDSISHHILAARNVLVFHAAQTNQADFITHKMIFLQGSPALDHSGPIPTGRLSGIVYHHVPFFFRGNRIPSYQTNCIEDWDEKVKAIVSEVQHQKLSLISGIPPWCIMFFEKLMEETGKKSMAEIFPELKLFIHGGVNFSPYEQKMKALMGADIPMLETFPASEGFIAYQYDGSKNELLLNVNAGIFYEFIPLENYLRSNFEAIPLEYVTCNVNYVLVLTTNAGLWRYVIGDTIKFTGLKPFTIQVTGRIKQYISAFGEHVIAEEIEAAMQACLHTWNIDLVDYHVFPDVAAARYVFLIEAANHPSNHAAMQEMLQTILVKKNIYYRDLVDGNMLELPQIVFLRKNSFADYQRSVGKLGGQNKVVRLSNDPSIGKALLAIQS